MHVENNVWWFLGKNKIIIHKDLEKVKTFIMKSPISKSDRISFIIRTHSTSGTISLYCPAISKSCNDSEEKKYQW